MNLLRDTAPLQGDAVQVEFPHDEATPAQHPAWAAAAIANRCGPLLRLLLPAQGGSETIEISREHFLAEMAARGYAITGRAHGVHARTFSLTELPMFNGLFGPIARGDFIDYTADELIDRTQLPEDLTDEESDFWLSLPARLTDAQRRGQIEYRREGITARDAALREQEKQREAEREAQRARRKDPYYKLEQSCYPKRPRQVLRKARGRHWRLPGVVGNKAAWSVPATGGYGRGWDCGYALAKLYLQHVGKGEPSPCANTLYHIVESMFAKHQEISARAGQNALEYSPSHNTEPDSFRAQLLAFFQMIEIAASAGVRFSTVGKSVNVDERSLIRAANRALSFDDKAYWAGLDELEPDED